MTVFHSFTCQTRGFSDVHNITDEIQSCLESSGIDNGIAVISVPGSTASITTIEYEPGVIEDLKKAVERLAPRDMHYDHDARWGDGNGFAHVRAALLGPSIAVPVKNKKLILGTWQQIILIDFDNRSRRREIAVQIVGD